MLGFGKAGALRELRAAIGDGDAPAKQRGERDDGLRVFSSAEDDQALRGGKVSDIELRIVGIQTGGAARAEECNTRLLDLFRDNALTREGNAAIWSEDCASKRCTLLRQPGDDAGFGAGERSFHGLEQGAAFGSVGGFEEEIDDTAATEAVRNIRRVVEEGGVALDDGAIVDHPCGFTNDFGFKAAAADGAGAFAVGADEQMRSGAAVGGAFGADEGDENAGCAVAPLPDDAPAVCHGAVSLYLYRVRVPTRCFGRNRKPVHVSSIEICATLSKPAANTGPHPLSRDRSDFMPLDFLG